jgi:hypothetical protein
MLDSKEKEDILKTTKDLLTLARKKTSETFDILE